VPLWFPAAPPVFLQLRDPLLFCRGVKRMAVAPLRVACIGMG
jgi:hypothetical protein